MGEIKNIVNPNEKSQICDEILRALPDWFGVETSIVDYVQQVQELPFYAVFDNEKVIGFVAIKPQTPFAAEICVMGIFEEYHRQGIGKMLIECCEAYGRENKLEFLTVKTLAESRESNSYEKTRRFYLTSGFKPLEVFPLLWDKDNPCLLMVKNLSRMELENDSVKRNRLE